MYTGDPGVRNPFFNQGYAPSNGVSPYTLYPAQPANSLPAGLPLPVNVAFPSTGTAPTMDTIAMPPPIPPARLLQVPDAYGSGRVASRAYTGVYNPGSPLAPGNLPPALEQRQRLGRPVDQQHRRQPGAQPLAQ